MVKLFFLRGLNTHTHKTDSRRTASVSAVLNRRFYLNYTGSFVSILEGTSSLNSKHLKHQKLTYFFLRLLIGLLLYSLSNIYFILLIFFLLNHIRFIDAASFSWLLTEKFTFCIIIWHLNCFYIHSKEMAHYKVMCCYF